VLLYNAVAKNVTCFESVPPTECREEKTKTDEYKLLCHQLGMDFVPIIFTATGGMGEHGGMGEQIQGQFWNPRW
jgi:hypothetical protein